MTKKKVTSEIGTPASDLLEAQDLNPAPAPPKKSHHKKPSSDNLSFEELQQKLARSFNFMAFVFKSNKTYKEKDFIEEAKDLARLASKYELITMGLTLLDPLFFLFGIVGKISEMLKDRQPKAGIDKQPPAGSAVVPNPFHAVINQ